MVPWGIVMLGTVLSLRPTCYTKKMFCQSKFTCVMHYTHGLWNVVNKNKIKEQLICQQVFSVVNITRANFCRPWQAPVLLRHLACNFCLCWNTAKCCVCGPSILVVHNFYNTPYIPVHVLSLWYSVYERPVFYPTSLTQVRSHTQWIHHGGTKGSAVPGPGEDGPQNWALITSNVLDGGPFQTTLSSDQPKLSATLVIPAIPW